MDGHILVSSFTLAWRSVTGAVDNICAQILITRNLFLRWPCIILQEHASGLGSHALMALIDCPAVINGCILNMHMVDILTQMCMAIYGEGGYLRRSTYL